MIRKVQENNINWKTSSNFLLLCHFRVDMVKEGWFSCSHRSVQVGRHLYHCPLGLLDPLQNSQRSMRQSLELCGTGMAFGVRKEWIHFLQKYERIWRIFSPFTERSPWFFAPAWTPGCGGIHPPSSTCSRSDPLGASTSFHQLPSGSCVGMLGSVPWKNPPRLPSRSKTLLPAGPRSAQGWASSPRGWH